MSDEVKTDEVTEETTAPAETAEVKAETKTEAAPAEEPKAKAEVPAQFKALVETIEKLSVLELSELVKALEERFGVSAAAPMMMGAAPAAGADAGPAEEAKNSWTVVLSDAGAQKINVIKAVREVTGLGLAESKALVDGAPKTVKENVKTEEANEIKAKLEAAGASVEMK